MCARPSGNWLKSQRAIVHPRVSSSESPSWPVSVADLGLDIIKCRLSAGLPRISPPNPSPESFPWDPEPVTPVATLLAGCCRLFSALRLQLRARCRVSGSASGCSCNSRVKSARSRLAGGHECHHKCANVSCLHAGAANKHGPTSINRFARKSYMYFHFKHFSTKAMFKH